MSPRIHGYDPTGAAPPEFGIDANAVKVRTVNLAVARVTPERIEIGGSVLWAVTSTSLAALVDIRLNDQQRDPIPFQAGMFIRGVRFSRIYISNLAQAGQTITLLHAVEGPGNIQIENPAAIYNLVSLIKPATINAGPDLNVPDTTLTVIYNADPTRHYAIISALMANTGNIRINAGAPALQGVELAPGDSVILSGTAGIYCYQATGVAQTICRCFVGD